MKKLKVPPTPDDPIGSQNNSSKPFSRAKNRYNLEENKSTTVTVFETQLMANPKHIKYQVVLITLTTP